LICNPSAYLQFFLFSSSFTRRNCVGVSVQRKKESFFSFCGMRKKRAKERPTQPSSSSSFYLATSAKPHATKQRACSSHIPKRGARDTTIARRKRRRRRRNSECHSADTSQSVSPVGWLVGRWPSQPLVWPFPGSTN
jgi:hypothetical protein